MFRILRGFEQLSCSSGWQDMAKYEQFTIVASAGLKGISPIKPKQTPFQFENVMLCLRRSLNLILNCFDLKSGKSIYFL